MIATRFFLIFLPYLADIFKVFKSTSFWVHFSLKSTLMNKTLLDSVKTLKRYCKNTLNVFKKKLWWSEKNLIYMLFLCQIEVLLLHILKTLKIPGFFLISQIPGFLCLNCQIQGFFMFFKVSR